MHSLTFAILFFDTNSDKHGVVGRLSHERVSGIYVFWEYFKFFSTNLPSPSSRYVCRGEHLLGTHALPLIGKGEVVGGRTNDERKNLFLDTYQHTRALPAARLLAAALLINTITCSVAFTFSRYSQSTVCIASCRFSLWQARIRSAPDSLI